MTDEQVEAAATVLFHNWPHVPSGMGGLRTTAKDALAAAERVAWQPIETLEPSDDVRRNVLLWHEPSRSSYVGHRTSNGFWSGYHRGASRFMPAEGEPTHWRPLPEPPK